jgi:DNA helicase-2/ATP-dependent DNA helicase PcrA
MGQAVEKYTKCLFTNRMDGELPRVIDTRTEPEQAMFICRSINDLLLQGRSIREIAVLFRAAYQSFELELELNRQGIPYVKYGGFKFMESAHIKDLLSHFRVVLNRDDTIGWMRILRLIKNIGHGRSRFIIDWMRETQCHAWQIGEWPGARKKDGGLERLAKLLKALSAPDVSPDRAVKLTVEYYEPILKEKYDDFPRRLRDLEQLSPMAARYRRLRAFMDDLIMEPPTSSLDMDRQTRPESLTLSTVHSAKGLEWSSVFILWVMDGYFPPSKAMGNMDAVEEERRLMYVASTRAKDQLTLCYPSQESPPFWSGRNGPGRYARGGLSSFIQALSEDVFEHRVSSLPGRRPPARWPADQPPILQMEEKNTPRLRPGDRVRHPAFGRGVVSKFLDREKVEVLFRNVGRKLLHLEYTTLEKM